MKSAENETEAYGVINLSLITYNYLKMLFVTYIKFNINLVMLMLLGSMTNIDIVHAVAPDKDKLVRREFLNLDDAAYEKHL